jgi:hypothetical protein
MKKRSKTDDLLKILAQKAPHAASGSAMPERPASHVRPRVQKTKSAEQLNPNASHLRAVAPPPVRGKAIQFYLHAPDQKLIREFAVWLAPHRKRINDSLVVKTVLRAAKTGPDLLAAYDAAVKVDGRTRRKGRGGHEDARGSM